MKQICLLALLSLLTSQLLLAQDPDKNLTIQSQTETYSFVKGDKQNPVKIEQALNTVYHCHNFQTSIRVAEFYNDQIEMSGARLLINGKRIKGAEPVHEYYNSEGIFYSDARVCYFDLALGKNDNLETSFEKRVLDPRYFTSIYLSEPYRIQHKEVRITVPKWMKVEILEYNFKGYFITKKVDNGDKEDTYTWTIKNLPGLKSEDHAPGPSFYAPHLLILTKHADIDGKRITYFNTLEDQYKWYRQLVNQIGNEPSAIKAATEEITKGVINEFEKVKAVYQWIQNNIRYIAYEDGIAGFKPDKAQEVLRKKYGDCKGMANLMVEMLKVLGLDGRKCWIGTNHIAYDYSTPSLSVDNHMIAAWMYQGKTYFLDPTEKYIGFGEIAERIQGRQVLIEDGDKYLLQRTPVHQNTQNTSYEKRTLSIQDNDLAGSVVHIWKGEGKEWMLSALNSIKSDKQEEALKKFLSKNNPNYQISNLKIHNLKDYNSDLRVEYDLVLKGAVSSFESQRFLEVDEKKDLSHLKLDTAKRTIPFQFSYKHHIIFETEIKISSGFRAEHVPDPMIVNQPEYKFTGNWKVQGNTISYRKEIQFNQVLLTTDRFQQWNSDIGALNQFYNNQLTLIK